ncbi:hypothetical protein [Haloplanus ruber]|uniref:hypothetical protein n=1 Tax=Haloplanus ruber TaxID=869892 RepID=UPI002110EA13|nr:hypothetical protein [Haloplanus ruber]
MNLREHATLGPCDDCDRIRRCRPVDGVGWACLECVPLGAGNGEVDAIATSSNQSVATDGGESE